MVVDDPVVRHRVDIARDLIGEIRVFDERLKGSNKQVAEAVTASGTTVTNVVGVGPICAAIIVGQTGNIDRFATKNHFATYNATAPIEASSGNHVRHRLNLRGNRQLNYALYQAAITQISRDTEGRVYYDRKRVEGKSSKEAIRCLKRQISDVVYRHLVADAKRQPSR